jgi:predicted ferric reductase
MSYDMAVWEMIRATGLVAYVLLTVSVAVGIAVKLRSLDWLMRRSWVLEVHQTSSVLAVAFTAGHMLILLLGRHVQFTIVSILVPFVSSWNPVWVAAGIFSMYLAVILTGTSYLRSRVGWRAWRAIHYSGFACWTLALGHSIFAGSDTSAPAVQYLYLGSAALVAALTGARLLGGPGSRARESAASAGKLPDREQREVL